MRFLVSANQIHHGINFMLFKLCKNSCLLILIVCICACNNAVDMGSNNFIGNIAYTNIWQRINSNFSLPDNYRNIPVVQSQINWYKNHPQHVYQIIENAKPYLYYVVDQVEQRALPGELALLPFIESNFDPFAYSKVGATGLWQIMPGTASGYGVTINWWLDGRRDIVTSTDTALNYFTYLHGFFNNDWLYAISAYDSGEGTVKNAIHKQLKKKIVNFWSLSLPYETKSYVPKLLALKEIIKYPDKYGIKLPYLKNKKTFVSFTMPYQINLYQISSLAGIPIAELRKFNPGFRRDVSEPNNPVRILIPESHAKAFKDRLSKGLVKKSSEYKWQKYTVLEGDTLSQIAVKFATTVNAIQDSNNLKSNRIQVGQRLLITTSHDISTNKIPMLSLKDLNIISQDKMPGPKQKIHSVQHGDTVSTIARKYRVKVREVEFWNGINARNSLKVGDNIVIWKSILKSNSTYKVKEGDTLGLIAKKYNSSISKIKSLNKLKTSLIKVGQVIKIN